MAANSTEILHDFSPLLRVYKNGRVERLIGTEYAPPSADPATRVQSKDIKIAPELNVSARLYLPKNANPSRKLPLLVYFHGGGFIVGSAFSPLYHQHLNALVAEANIVAVSVEYRLAPEHPLPIAYEDSWLALKWAASHSTGDGDEAWIKDYADLDHVYIGGDSAGANIAHNVAMRVGSENLEHINLDGVFLNCPFFWGKERIGNEAITINAFPKNFLDNIWLFACPNTKGLDDPSINPGADPNLSRFGSKKVLVCVAEKDIYRERGFYYKEVLDKSGWEGHVEVVEVKGEKHIFSVCYPKSYNGMAMLKRVASFLNQHKPCNMFNSKDIFPHTFQKSYI
ncbi:putative carboxylesterase [Abeliophyllum distichum]|uniref:Carboxylesterase n=1 Tax=Abeliophyllum distichum TaxID=126358 RepID=A0ABD1NY11_9LAMI